MLQSVISICRCDLPRIVEQLLMDVVTRSMRQEKDFLSAAYQIAPAGRSVVSAYDNVRVCATLDQHLDKLQTRMGPVRKC